LADEVRLIAAFALAALITLALTPIAIRVAHGTGFYDHPVGYKQHRAPTPYLGGVAVVLGFLAGSIAFGGGFAEFASLTTCGIGALVLGTVDDRVGLPIGPRVVGATACAGVLTATGLGWDPTEAALPDLLLTVILVLAVINAYNLMDNLDGAAATVAAVSAALLGVYLAAEGSPLFGAVALALAGACVGFLPYNLVRPGARIFLGDGGSMAIGLVIATLIMNLPEPAGFEWELVPLALLAVGLPAFDTALVIVSRRRRGVSMLRGGRDHLTHRLYARVGSTRFVAAAFAAGQAVLVGFALLLGAADPQVAVAAVCICVALALGAIGVLEAPSRTPAIADRRE
jgi:UDP-GlcNAc:undecaprenyl-phosphate/decaprenyl-phosphate GlcNAc-1-phosphate transferase